ncbi:adenylyl-sulfate reductase subunit alpha [Halanaerobaculum tunisiense]
MEVKTLSTDLLIIGGGAAGCFAGVTAKEENLNLDVLIIEKGHIERSGCLAAGINAINAYITSGETPESYLEYVKNDSNGLIREDLVLSIGKHVNEVTETIENWGLPILKDEEGNYIARSSRSIKIKGEKLKPILAKKVEDTNINVLNRTMATNYIIEDNKVKGCFAFNVKENIFYVIKSKAVICATGGAAGIYKPNNSGTARHKMWYPPFNTGAGYAMGIRAGAEMTTFEMRFVALRVKDVFAPTGTLAFSGARQVNNLGEEYLDKYEDVNTAMRLYATIEEEKAGRGPCYMVLEDFNVEERMELYKSFLNMSPDLILKLEQEFSSGRKIKFPISGSEPYIVGGHCQAGYWVDVNRKTTLDGLYAAGDVAGGAPKKYASGAFVEGKIAALSAVDYINNDAEKIKIDEAKVTNELKRIKKPIDSNNGLHPENIENKLQEIMEQYAGGKEKHYQLNENDLKVARDKLKKLKSETEKLLADNLYELVQAHEVIDRIDVAQVLIEHLIYRQETRWPGYQTRVDFPEQDDQNWLKFINTRLDLESNSIEIIERDITNKSRGGKNDY